MFVLSSTNPQFSFLLGKNPASGVSVATLKQGVAVGWFPPDKQNQTWCATFFDQFNKSSFGSGNEASGNYLDYHRFASPQLFPQLVKTFLEHLLSVEDNVVTKFAPYDDASARHTLIMPQVYLRSFRPQLFRRLCGAMHLHWECETKPLPLGQSPSLLYRITVSGEMKLSAFLQRVYLLSLVFHRPAHSQGAFVEPGYVAKIGKLAQVIDAPYFLRKQLMLKLAIGSANSRVFERPGMTLVEGTNAVIRERFTLAQLERFRPQSPSLIDFGCGEHPSQRLRKWDMSNPDWQYIGIDADEQVRAHLAKKYPSTLVCATLEVALAQIQDKTPHVVLATEVLEHIPVWERPSVMSRLFQGEPLMVVVTTPNRDFNPHYHLEPHEKRHPDHVYEYDEKEWHTFILDHCPPHYRCHFHAIGDTVDGQCCILGATYTVQEQ